MNREEALQALSLEVTRLRGRTHAELTALVDTPAHFEHIGISGQTYQVDVSAAWDDKPGQVLRLFFSVDDGGLRAYLPLTKSGLVPPDESFDGNIA
jgi:hypothetical protein